MSRVSFESERKLGVMVFATNPADSCQRLKLWNIDFTSFAHVLVHSKTVMTSTPGHQGDILKCSLRWRQDTIITENFLRNTRSQFPTESRNQEYSKHQYACNSPKALQASLFEPLGATALRRQCWKSFLYFLLPGFVFRNLNIVPFLVEPLHVNASLL